LEENLGKELPFDAKRRPKAHFFGRKPRKRTYSPEQQLIL
jgi:hypothetical protein